MHACMQAHAEAHARRAEHSTQPEPCSLCLLPARCHNAYTCTHLHAHPWQPKCSATPAHNTALPPPQRLRSLLTYPIIVSSGPASEPSSCTYRPRPRAVLAALAPAKAYHATAAAAGRSNSPCSAVLLCAPHTAAHTKHAPVRTLLYCCEPRCDMT